jgi:hypothetical protein
MTAGSGKDRQGGMSADALRREAERAALREARLAEALRQNLKRRKEQARTRVRTDQDHAASHPGPTVKPDQ